jgi:hypothetical protein
LLASADCAASGEKGDGKWGYRAIEIRFNHIEKGDLIMKRKMLVGILVLVGLFSFGVVWAAPPASSAAWAGPAASHAPWGAPPASNEALAGPPASQELGGIYYTPAIAPTDALTFTTKFWQEKFFGGGPGQEGNTLMAIGQGFVFQNAVLTGVPEQIAKPDWCINSLAAVGYKTTYENGRLTLNPSGPWLTKGTLIDRDVKAVNTSCHAADGALLGFRLVIGIGEENAETFEKFAEVPYSVEASFDIAFDAGTGLPTNYKMFVDEDEITVQKGYYFGAKITIGSPTP